MNAFVTSSALALSAMLCAAPSLAHHNSIDPEFIETMMPGDALDQHNEVVGDVLERLNDMEVGNRSMAGSTTNDMDPADNTQGANCSVMVDGDCETGSDNSERSPRVFDYLDP